MGDKILLHEMQKGNSNAYKRIFLKYYSPLCEYASQFVSDVEAEELVQDIMLHLWEAREHLVIVGSIKSYLFVSIKNRSLNLIRNQKYKAKVHSALYDQFRDQFESPEYYVVEELERKIHKAVQELPESYRETFELSRFRELTNSQIASTLNVSVKTVEYRITRSLKLLRERLKDYYIIAMLFV